MSDSKLIELQNFFPANRRFFIYFGPNFFLQPVDGCLSVRILCDVIQPPKPTSFFYEV